MDLKGIILSILSEICQTVKDKFCMISICFRYVESKTNKQTYIDIEKNLMVAKGEEERG